MIKLAILGTENSHSWYFSSLLAPKNRKSRYPDVEHLGVWGDSSDARFEQGCEKIKEMSSVTRFAEHYNDFLDEADAVMITAADGAKHFEYAKSYIEKGAFVWLDKPTACDPKEALAMWELAEKYGAVLSGGSTLQYDETVKSVADEVKSYGKPILGGNVSAPLMLSLGKSYGGFWFYSQHLVQMMISVFGTGVRSVKAEETKNGVRAVYKYDDFEVTAFYGSGFSVTVYLNGVTAIGKSFELCDEYYLPLINNFYKVLKEKKGDKTKKEFLLPVYIIDATIKSYTEHTEITIEI